MALQSKQVTYLITDIGEKINRLGDTKKMITDYKYKLPDEFENLARELLYNIEANINYIQKIFLLKPTKKNIDNLWGDHKENWDAFSNL